MLDRDKIPNHIAIVMDGNGRWAKKRGLPRLSGHNAGMKAMKEIIKSASALEVKHLTVYAFSTENWKRAATEVSGIFKLLVTYVDNELDELHENNVKVKILGDYRMLPAPAVDRIDKAVEKTKSNTGLQFNIALNYGSRDEIVKAVARICEQVEKGDMLPTEVSEKVISDNLYTGRLYADVPDPDLVIRAGGEMRISNYLLWQCAYSEFVFSDVLWPDFTPTELERAIFEYQSRERRFGGR